MTSSLSYDELIRQEARHWGSVHADPDNPQIWDDAALFEIFFGNERRTLIERAVASGPRLLELGCGNGNLSIQLAERGLQVEGIDLSEERIDLAQRSSSHLPADQRPHFTVGDLNTIELPAERFDCVVAHGSLHHIAFLGHLLDQVHRTLRPSGRLLVFDYVGMGAARKLAAASLYALLPTYKPYSEKWKLRSRLTAFLASEKQKRVALHRTGSSSLHKDSPFEEISGPSIIAEIRSRFQMREERTTNPFWFYLVAKLRTPHRLRLPVAKAFHAMDRLMLGLGFKGAFVFIDAMNS